MKWQTVKKLIGGTTIGIVGLFAILFLLAGVEYTHSGDIICDEVCESYINVTTSYWRICFDNYNGTKYENEVLSLTNENLISGVQNVLFTPNALMYLCGDTGIKVYAYNMISEISTSSYSYSLSSDSSDSTSLSSESSDSSESSMSSDSSDSSISN